MNKAKSCAALTDIMTALNAVNRALGDLTSAINEDEPETKSDPEAKETTKKGK